MAGYGVALPLSIIVIQAHADAPWRYALAVLPMIPAMLALVAFLRFFGRIDELQRRIHEQAFAFSFGATAIITFTYGLLENVGLPRLNWIWVWPIMCIAWGLHAAFASRFRYQ